MNVRYFAILSFLISSFLLKSQDRVSDSLSLVLRNAKHDTTRVQTLLAIGEKIYTQQPDSALLVFRNAGALCESKLSRYQKGSAEYNVMKKALATSLHRIGFMVYNQGDIRGALEYFLRSVKIEEEVGDKMGVALSLNNIGYVFQNQGDIQNALEYYRRSLMIREEIGDKDGIAMSQNNIGLIYDNQGDTAKALEYFRKNLVLYNETGNKKGVAVSLNNIGNIYRNQGDFDKALEYHGRSLEIKKAIGDKRGIAQSLNNLGYIYENRGDMKNALEYLSGSLKIYEEIGDKRGISTSLNNIGGIYFKNKKYKEALDYALKSMKLSNELGFPENIKNSAMLLSKTYKATGMHQSALENYELFIRMRDSLVNEENKKASIKNQLKYEYEKKAAADSVLIAEEKKVTSAQLKQEATQRYALYGGLSLVGLFSLFMVNRLQVTRRQKGVIETQKKLVEGQKHLIEEKHKEITDSINYAERIQRSFLATKQHLDDHLNDAKSGQHNNYFIFFKPKDVVSGDFYWSATLTNGNFAIATADSTGHGVPGSIMSLLNITSLEKAIETETEPHKILNATRKIIIDRLKKDGSRDGGKDGMDCSLCVFDFENKKLLVASANNPVWIMRKNNNFGSLSLETGMPESEIIVTEIKPDKIPVGKHDKDDESFTLHQIDILPGDMIYTLTDGFPDQFGGEKGKKFMSKKLRDLIAANAQLPMEEQKEILEKTFSDWTGELEQIDDVTVIGIRVLF